MPIKTEHNFLHCPSPNCDKKFGTNDWNLYTIDKIKPHNGHEVTNLYKCPYCGFKFTVFDCMLNAINVTGIKESEDICIIDTSDNCKVILRVSYEGLYEIGDKLYIQFPGKLATDHHKMISVQNSLSDEEISNKARSLYV